MTFFLLIRSPLSNFLPSKHMMTFFCSNCFSSDRPQRPKTDRPTGHLPGVPAAQSTSGLRFIAKYIHSSLSTSTISTQSHSFHQLILEETKINDFTTCKILVLSIIE